MSEQRPVYLHLTDEQATLDLGAQLAAEVEPGAIIYLHGPLGAGKTTLARGFLRALGVSGAVKSPTYTLIEIYDLPQRLVVHMDLYRMADPEELAFLGLDDFLSDPSMVALIEWPKHGEGVLPQPTLEVTLEHLPEGGRRAHIQAAS